MNLKLDYALFLVGEKKIYRNIGSLSKADQVKRNMYTDEKCILQYHPWKIMIDGELLQWMASYCTAWSVITLDVKLQHTDCELLHTWM